MKSPFIPSLFLLGACLAAVRVQAQTATAAAPSPVEALSVDRIVRSEGLGPVFGLDSYFVPPDRPVDGYFSAGIAADDLAQLQKAHAAGVQPDCRIEVRLTSANDDSVVWSQAFPVDWAEFVTKKENRITDQITIPGNVLKVGKYRLTAFAVTSTGQPQPFLISLPTDFGAKTKVECPNFTELVVRPDRNFVKPSTCVDSPTLLTHSIDLHSPSATATWWNAGPAVTDARRTIWDMCIFEDAVYLGTGSWAHKGPYSPIYALTVDGAGHTEVNESYIVYGSSVEMIRTFHGELYVPETDRVRETHALGDLYEMKDGAWRKKRTYPNGLHMLGICYWKGRLYATAGTEPGAAICVSDDDGTTWRKIKADEAWLARDFRLHELTPLGDRLLIVPAYGEKAAYFLDAKGVLERRNVEMFPGMQGAGEHGKTAWRLKSFAGGAVYTSAFWGEPMKHPLYFISDPARGGEIVETLKDLNVMDIQIDGNTCYVLADTPAGNDFENQIFSTTDMKSWTRVADFKTTALPFSMIHFKGKFYVGLGDRTAEATDEASGRLLRLE